MLTAAEVLVLVEAERTALVKGTEVAPRTHFLVPEQNLPELRAKLDGLVKRGAKLGITSLAYTVGDFVDEVYYREVGGDERVKCLVRKYVVEVVGEQPKLAGWVFGGTIQHLGEAGNVVRAILDEVAVPPKFRSTPPLCEHCNTVRRRVDTYLLYSSAGGTWKQIGKNCLVDFLGSVDADRLARIAEYLGEALRCCGDGEDEGMDYGNNLKCRYPLVDVLAQTHGAVAQFGWLSKGKAKERDDGAMSTAAIVEHNFTDKYENLKKDGILIKHADGAKPVEAATKAIEWAKAITDAECEKSDYMYNIRLIARLDSVETRLFGYACSILPAAQREWDKAREQQLAAERGTASTHVGTVGEKLVVTVTVAAIKHLESDWGCSTLYMFVDASGNKFKWFCSGKELDICPADAEFYRDVIPGDTITIKGTVKGFDEYKGVKQTQLSRCAIFVPKEPKAKKARGKKASSAQATLPVAEAPTAAVAAEEVF